MFKLCYNNYDKEESNMNNEKMKDYTLNAKEYNEIEKAHNDFNQTMFGKKIKLLIMVLSGFTVFFIFMSFFCIILNSMGEENFDIFAAICGALFFINISLVLVSQMLYENMVMCYGNYKK